VPVGGTAPWSRAIGGTGEDRAQAVAVAGDGSVAVVGYFSGTVDFGGGPRTAHALPWLDPNSDQDAFVAKFSASGAHLWDRIIGTEALDKGQAVAIAPNGDVVVAGMTSSYLDLGDGVLQPIKGAGDAFVATYRGSDGAFVRGRTFGSTGNDVARGVAVDSAGDVFVAGNFAGTADFGGGPTTAAGGSTDLDAFVAKYSPTGAFAWAKTIGGAGFDSANAVAVDAAGNVRVAGKIGYPGTSGSTMLTSTGGNDAFVAELTSAGAVQWAKNYGGTADDEAMAIASDGAGNAAVVGTFQGTNASFGGSPLTAAGLKDAFVMRVSPAGVFQWAIAKGGAGDDAATGIALDGSGNAFVTGSFAGTVNFGGGALTATAATDAFVAKYNSSGAYLAQHKYGALSMQYGAAIGIQTSGRAVVAGYQGNAANTSIDFGNGPLVLVGGASWDGFLGAVVP
jgi:hypothetical protein